VNSRGLIVLADGAQAAFCAGVVAELAKHQTGWQEGAGAGLGAAVAALALAGEAEEAARRFSRGAEEPEGLFRSALSLAREQVNQEGFLLLPDPWRLSGWLAAPLLQEYLAPDLVLAKRVRLWLALEDLFQGSVRWCLWEEGQDLVAACAFPGGWGPDDQGRWGGVGVCGELPLPPLSSSRVDLVCGFPVPKVARPGLDRSLFTTWQRREELAAAALAERWQSQLPGVRVYAPQASSFQRFTQRDNALLGVEYPLPLEQNAALCQLLVEYGHFVAAQVSIEEGEEA
jgi:predicted acylesterase/phospholipase RssA